MGGFIERQSDEYSATPGDTSFVIKAYTQKESNILATIGQNFAFWDSYVSPKFPSLPLFLRMT
jgi:phospholipase C